MQFRLFFVFLFLLQSCIGGGTHGYIKSYRYDIPKCDLEKAVRQVILINPDIQQDSVKGYYNDDASYVSVSIANNGLRYTYVFRYYGGKEYWDTSKTSAIFIAYSYDEKREGGSSGNKGIKWYDFGLKQKLVDLFERELVNGIDSLLKLNHTEE